MVLTFSKLIAVLGGWTVVIVAIVTLANRLITERIFSKWRRDEQSTLEGLRHSLLEERLMLESTIRGSQQGQDMSHEKRLAAIEHLWSAVIKLRSDFSMIRYFFGILLPNEYDLAFKSGHERLAASISKIDDAFVARAIEAVDHIELERPYLGEVLWLRFFVYRAFLGRLGYLIWRGKEEHHIADWREDDGIRRILSGVFPMNTLETLIGKKQDVWAINRVFEQLESVILEEISLIVSGRRSASESFENAKELHRSVVDLAISNNGVKIS